MEREKSKERFDVLVGEGGGSVGIQDSDRERRSIFSRPLELGRGLTQWAALEKCNIR